MENFKSNYKWAGEALLINKKINLKEKVEFSISLDLSELGEPDFIKVITKMPGSAIQSPYEIPYENYTLEFEHENIKYIIENMLMKEWKEVYLYSYSFTFISNKLSSQKIEKADLIEFFINDLIIGYDEMVMNPEIINFTDLNLDYKNNEYKIRLTANPEFNNNKQFKATDTKKNFTTKISFDLKENQDDQDINQIAEILEFILSIAYGSKREIIMSLAYKDKLLINQEIKNKFINLPSKNLPLIPYQYSGVLSSFLINTFNEYVKLDQPEKEEINTLANLLFNLSSNITFTESFSKIAELYKFIGEEPTIELNRNKYNEGDYKIIHNQLNYFYLYLLKKINYSGKYTDWSNIIPTISEI